MFNIMNINKILSCLTVTIIVSIRNASICFARRYSTEQTVVDLIILLSVEISSKSFESMRTRTKNVMKTITGFKL